MANLEGSRKCNILITVYVSPSVSVSARGHSEQLYLRSVLIAVFVYPIGSASARGPSMQLYKDGQAQGKGVNAIPIFKRPAVSVAPSSECMRLHGCFLERYPLCELFTCSKLENLAEAPVWMRHIPHRNL
jgi:hypothetical protein